MQNLLFCLFLFLYTFSAASKRLDIEQLGSLNSDSPAKLVSASVGGRPIELYAFPGGYFGIVPLSGPITVTIKVPTVSGAVVRPLSAHILPRASADRQSIELRLVDSTPLTVELNGDKGAVIHLFPYMPQPVPSASDPKVHFFGPGTTTAGIVTLQAGDTLYLAPGAWVKGLVRSRSASGVKILGAGVLDASGYTDVHAAPYGNNDAIDLEDSPNAVISGITIFNSHNWTVHLRHSDSAKVDSVKVLNPGTWVGDDGIDVDSSSHVTISHVFVRTNDDCIAIKNIVNKDTSDIHVSNSVCWNESHGGNGLEIGYETGSVPIHDVSFSNMDLIHIEHGAALSIHDTGSSSVQNVSYSNINVEDVKNELMDFSVFFSNYSPDHAQVPSVAPDGRMVAAEPHNGAAAYPLSQKAVVASKRGQVSNITVMNLNVVGTGPLPPSLIAGFDNEHEVNGVTVEGLHYAGTVERSAAAARIAEKFVNNVVIR